MQRSSKLQSQPLAPVFKLPPEVHYQVVSSLEAEHILALRQTCHYFYVLTHERGLWTALLNRMRAKQPLPYSRSELESMVTPHLERVLLAASRTEQSFLLRRESFLQAPVSAEAQWATTLCALCFVSELFLLSVIRTTTTAVIQVWDVSTSHSSLAKSPYVSLVLNKKCVFLTHAVSVSAEKSTLYVAVNEVTPQTRIHIYSVPLSSHGQVNGDHSNFVLTACFLVDPEDVIESIDPLSCSALIYSSPTSIEVVNWKNDTRSKIALLPENPNGTTWEWNDVTELLFCGPYVLCFRLHSIEAYPLPLGTPDTADSVTLPVLQHRFRSTTFNTVSLSCVRHSPRPSGDVFTVFMLVNDLYKEMLHYQITVTMTPVPSLKVKLLAQSKTAVSETTLAPENDVMPGRAFEGPCASAWALGSAGLRGVWVGDAYHGDPSIVAFTTHPSKLHSIEESSSEESQNEMEEKMPSMNRQVISAVRLHHPRDYIRACDISELTGRIALGSRTGAIWLL